MRPIVPSAGAESDARTMVLEREGHAETHEQTSQHTSARCTNREGLGEEREQQDSHQHCRGTAPRKDHRHGPGRCGKERQDHHQAVEVFKRRPPRRYQQIGRHRAALHETADKEHGEKEGEGRRRHKLQRRAGLDTRRQNNGEKEQRQGDRFSCGCHLRCCRRRRGSKSDASVISPASSSAFNSSA